MSLPDVYESAFVTITCDDPPTTIRALMGEDRPDISSGYGGWDEVERPRRKTVITWRGMPARRLQVSILIDNWTVGTSIERTIRSLEYLALPREGGQPPVVRVDAVGGALPWQTRRWVIDAISWGDALMNTYGNRVRQAATITFLEFVSDDLIERVAPSKKRRAKKKRATGAGKKKGAKEKRTATKRGKSKKKSGTRADATATTYDGEDLLSLAARELGDARRWREIADLNGIRDPRAIRVGQVIRLP
jgi:hypothetical protein